MSGNWTWVPCSKLTICMHACMHASHSPPLVDGSYAAHVCITISVAPVRHLAEPAQHPFFCRCCQAVFLQRVVQCTSALAAACTNHAAPVKHRATAAITRIGLCAHARPARLSPAVPQLLLTYVQCSRPFWRRRGIEADDRTGIVEALCLQKIRFSARRS